MLLCLHVEFVFMLMSFTCLTDDLLKDNPPSKFGWSISASRIGLFCEKYENPRNLGIVRACADKSHLYFIDFSLIQLNEIALKTRRFKSFRFPCWFHSELISIMNPILAVWKAEFLPMKAIRQNKQDRVLSFILLGFVFETTEWVSNNIRFVV